MSNERNSDNPESSNSQDNSLGKETITREKLIKAGWVVPAVVAINLPRAVQAQTGVPSAGAPLSPTVAPTGA